MKIRLYAWVLANTLVLRVLATTSNLLRNDGITVDAESTDIDTGYPISYATDGRVTFCQTASCRGSSNYLGGYRLFSTN